MARISHLLSVFLFCAIILVMCFAKPTEITTNVDPLNPIQPEGSELATSGSNREQRSPQFGLLHDYDDYSDYDDDDDESRHFKLGSKHKPHNWHHKPVGHGGHGGHGCRGYDCGGSYPEHGGYHQGGQGGTFATASAGSLNAGGKPHGGHSEANAQSASFSFGPYTASFSVAHASAGRQRF